jgi:hypothetical protein
VWQRESGGVIVARIAAAIAGTFLVLWTVGAAVKTVVLPRATTSLLTRWLFAFLRRWVFDKIASPKRSFEFRDRVMASYAPTGLLLLPFLWVTLVVVGFAGIFWGVGITPVSEAFVTSGSSVLTLGFVRPEGLGRVVLCFFEAIIGLGLVSLMLSYLPTIYSSFNRREVLVGRLEVRAGLPPSPAELLTRYARIGWLDKIDDELFPAWEAWFADIEESHTSQASLVFFRSPHPERSWITAAGCVLDTAAIVSSTVDRQRDAHADVLLRTGFFCLRRIADFFGIEYDAHPQPGDPISISRRDFDLLCIELHAAGVPLKADRDQAFRDFAGWRVNYDKVLLALCALVMAPPARWSSDRMEGERQHVAIRRSTMMRQ